MIFTHQMIGRAPVGERTRREVAPHSRNMNVTVVINHEMDLVYHQLGQFTVTRSVFQNFIMQLINQASELFPCEDHIHIDDIIYDGVRPHLPYRTKSASYAVAVQSIFESY